MQPQQSRELVECQCLFIESIYQSVCERELKFLLEKISFVSDAVFSFQVPSFVYDANFKLVLSDLGKLVFGFSIYPLCSDQIGRAHV